MADFIVNMQEAKEAIRRQYDLPPNVVISILSDVPTSKLEVSGGSDIFPDTDGWLTVPKEWNKPEPPSPACCMELIEVKYKDESWKLTGIGAPADWNHSWKQDGSVQNIVAYRKVVRQYGKWFNISEGWSTEEPPLLAQRMECIQVQLRDGPTLEGKPGWAFNWSQKEDSRDIVRYREIKYVPV